MQIFSDELHYEAHHLYWDFVHWLTTPRKQLQKERAERMERNERINNLLRKTFQGGSF